MPPGILQILTGLWAGYVIYAFYDTDDNFVRKRLNKTGCKKKTKRLYISFAQVLRPFSL